MGNQKDVGSANEKCTSQRNQASNFLGLLGWKIFLDF
jgi:hypothetical protein